MVWAVYLQGIPTSNSKFPTSTGTEFMDILQEKSRASSIFALKSDTVKENECGFFRPILFVNLEEIAAMLKPLVEAKQESLPFK